LGTPLLRFILQAFKYLRGFTESILSEAKTGLIPEANGTISNNDVSDKTKGMAGISVIIEKWEARHEALPVGILVHMGKRLPADALSMRKRP
jgi:hypothetical protein